jgi:hypothetical protein
MTKTKAALTKAPKSPIPFKYNLEQLFEVGNYNDYRPDHLFLAYFGDLPSVFIFERFDLMRVSKAIQKMLSKHLVKTISRDLYFSNNEPNREGVIWVFDNQLLIKIVNPKTEIYYCEASKQIAGKLAKELLPFSRSLANRSHAFLDPDVD